MDFENVDILRSFLFVEEKSFLISNNGEQVSAEEIEGNIVGIYFSSNKIQSSIEFTEKLKGVYKELKERGESFEIVSVICHEGSKQSFKQTAESLPWLSLPFEDERGDKLAYHFLIDSFPMLAIFGANGVIIRSDVSDLIEEGGIHAYPFSPEKLAEFDEMEKARLEAQTLESLLVDGERDFVIREDGIKVSLLELAGKTILFYYSSNECSPCNRFKPKLIEAYHDLKAKGIAAEVIYISGDKDQSAFHGSYSTMPWLALPFDDQRTKSLRRKLKLRGMPAVVAVGPNGQTITNKAKDFVLAFGAEAYPFTEEHLKGLVGRWPGALNHDLHREHEIELTPRYDYICDACGESGSAWSFCCKICDFDLDPECALGNEGGNGNIRTESSSNNGGGSDGLIFNGQVC